MGKRQARCRNHGRGHVGLVARGERFAQCGHGGVEGSRRGRGGLRQENVGLVAQGMTQVGVGHLEAR